MAVDYSVCSLPWQFRTCTDASVRTLPHGKCVYSELQAALRLRQQNPDFEQVLHWTRS
jgi:hypothetical protein